MPDIVIRTPRLVLTPITLQDAADLRRLAGDVAVARNALSIPHPFEEGMAEAWIDSLQATDAVYCIRTTEDGPLMGLIGLIHDEANDSAELSYWIGRQYWGQGYATEAVEAILRFGFKDMDLNRVFATSLARNLASGRVLEKAGFTVEGHLRQHVKHWGSHEDLLLHGMLRAEFDSKPGS